MIVSPPNARPYAAGLSQEARLSQCQSCFPVSTPSSCEVHRTVATSIFFAEISGRKVRGNSLASTCPLPSSNRFGATVKMSSRMPLPVGRRTHGQVMGPAGRCRALKICDCRPCNRLRESDAKHSRRRFKTWSPITVQHPARRLHSRQWCVGVAVDGLDH